ncbi:MAG TPA: VPLPA-CTERM sorting domain-containing protein [Spongiibacteraceae bacterium]|nr:VPLPA-CTERM sorting domain-containing protein [Spongiibacteraceae bacterium]
MKKLALATAVSALIASPSFAAYTGTATSGTVANQQASIVVSGPAATNVYYVDPASGAASNLATPAVQLVKTSNWTFDFTNLAAVSFTGNIVYGDYSTQTSVPSLSIDGRQTFTGVTQSFSGSAVYNESTNVLLFIWPAASGSGGSVQTQTASSCVNGNTSPSGNVCDTFAALTPSWEGLNLRFVFTEDRSSFAGTVTGFDTSGSGASKITNTINWQVAAAAPAVPVPAAAWLFGSGLLGLATAARRKSKTV